MKGHVPRVQGARARAGAAADYEILIERPGVEEDAVAAAAAAAAKEMEICIWQKTI